jgi:hypothetical protein
MPGGSGEGVAEVVKAVEEGRLDIADLDKAVRGFWRSTLRFTPE